MGLVVDVQDNIELSKEFDSTIVAELVLEGVLDHFQCPFECEVYLNITDDEEIHEINKEQRLIDRPTDVLSFPMIDWEKIADFDWAESFPYHFNPESGELMLGDIIISNDTMLRQAKEYGHSNKREFAFLLVHSLLHLLGYDHIEEDERVIMEEKQSEIMNRLNIHR